MLATGHDASAPPRLRYYQSAAVEALVGAVRRGESPVASLPTGSGKSLTIGATMLALVREVGAKRILVTVPSRELAEQDEAAIARFLDPDEIGVMCAALGRREADRPITIGTPQSLAGNVTDQPDFVFVDEAHLMPLHPGSWFARLFDGFPRGRRTPRIGLSATAFRAADGAIYGKPDAWFTSQPYEISVADLVSGGFLSLGRYVRPAVTMTAAGVGITGGDYNPGQLVRANQDLIGRHADIILAELRCGRAKGIVFAVTIEHAEAYRDALQARGEPTALIIGAGSAAERRAEVDDFRAGRKRLAVTVQAALTGFDDPEIDLVASCRPTKSPIIHTQSLGRATRPAPGKRGFLVLDFAGNVGAFGPVHAPAFDRSGQPRGGSAPWRPCRACGTYCHVDTSSCTHCSSSLPRLRSRTAHDLEYGTIRWRREAAAIAAMVRAGGTRLPVETIALHAYRKPADPESVSVMISFACGGDAVIRTWFKWLNIEPWRRMWGMLLGLSPAPRTLAEAYARRAELVRPASIEVIQDGNFWRVAGAGYETLEDDGAAAA